MCWRVLQGNRGVPGGGAVLGDSAGLGRGAAGGRLPNIRCDFRPGLHRSGLPEHAAPSLAMLAAKVQSGCYPYSRTHAQTRSSTGLCALTRRPGPLLPASQRWCGRRRWRRWLGGVGGWRRRCGGRHWRLSHAAGLWTGEWELGGLGMFLVCWEAQREAFTRTQAAHQADCGLLWHGMATHPMGYSPRVLAGGTCPAAAATCMSRWPATPCIP